MIRILGEWVPQYLDAYKRGTIKDDSFYTSQLVVRHIPQELIDMDMHLIKPMHLQKFYNEFAKTASKSYMDKVRVLINALYTTAFDNELCTKNPTKHLKIPQVREKPREAFIIEEVRLILNLAMTYENQRIVLGIMTLLLTGIRRGELLGLKPEDITDNSLTINRTVYLSNHKACIAEHAAKTEKSLRTVPLLPELAYRLQTMLHKGEFLFSTKNGTVLHPRDFTRDYNTFFKHLRDAEPSGKCLSPHCCRHTFATLTREFGADIRVVQELLGHTDIKTIARYSHVNMGCMQNAVTNYRQAILSQEPALHV